ncbi:ABC transporter permease [Alkalispirochaeta sphaeroplastigenens]|uniref:sn-glycerol-3-phosphate transport system permease protein UgpE n=1 Tax=Alkalispirochaeta sphaeroplastigenens TaxID=1187066 RepID=A0A2S4JGZ2_9SPIO|nr:MULTISPECIES: carbohydrate ABC transporter permease [Alkalispirochaeta]POQ98786.1 ABC transporter permease [Alkalispirochaeta sphaeroplastigenens]
MKSDQNDSASWRHLPVVTFLRKKKVFLHLILMAVAAITIVPYVWALSTSLKTRAAVFTPEPQWIPNPMVLVNYMEVFSMAPFGLYLINTIIVVLGVLAVQIFTVTTAAYAFSRLTFRGSNLLFVFFIIQMMLPVHAIIVPNYLTVRHLGVLNTRLAMMLPFFASGYGTFLLRQAFRQVPRDFEDAAVIDGCSGPVFIVRILMPMAKPTFVAFGLISIVTHWNDFFWPLVVTDTPSVRTLTLGLAMFVQQESGADWTLLMAATIFVTAPLLVLFVVYQRKFIESFMSAGLKG